MAPRKAPRGNRARKVVPGTMPEPTDMSPAMLPGPVSGEEDIEVFIVNDEDDPAGPQVLSSGGEGDVIVDFNPQNEPSGDSEKHEANLAEELDNGILGGIAEQLLDAVEQDERDRSEWLQQRADGLDLLGLKVEKPGSVASGSSSTAVPGQSNVRDPLLQQAVWNFQANSFAELCPAVGPCKAVNYGPETQESEKLAEELEKDINFYLASGVQGTATEYYPDTRRMLFWVGFASGMFKKIYRCPIRRRPVSESVDGADLIIPSNATDLENAGRITHQIDMRQSVMRRMQLLGVYRDVPLTAPTPQINPLQQKEGDIAGMNPNPTREQDQTYTIYECYCELDIPGFEHKEDGKVSGLPIPYRVTIDKDSRTVLEIRRNWKEGDEDYKPNIPFVLFPYATGLSIYGSGLLHMLGNITMAITAMLREGIDAGMYANFPGLLITKGATRQNSNELRVPPGGAYPINIDGIPGGDIRQAVMPLPYKDITPGLLALMQQMREVGQTLGAAANAPVGEGKADVPVGTMLAMVEQATKIEGGVHKALHAAQTREMQQLLELFRDDPEALWRANPRPAMGKDPNMRLQKFQQALADVEIVPASDPNVPSHMHRIMKAMALKQLTAGNPAYNQVAVDKHIAGMMHIDDFDSFIAPAQPPGQDPKLMAEMAKINIAQQKLALDGAKIQIEAQEKAADRASRETVEALKIANSLAVHPDANQVVDEQLMQMAPLIKPTAPVPEAPPTPGSTPMEAGGVVPPPSQPLPEQMAGSPDRQALRENVDLALEIIRKLGAEQRKDREKAAQAPQQGNFAPREFSAPLMPDMRPERPDYGPWDDPSYLDLLVHQAPERMQ